MSISGIKFSDPNLTKKFDLNNDGKVSIKELKQISKNDGNKNDLSEKDLESIGVTDKSIQSKVIEIYNKNHPSSANSISFPNKPQANNTKPDKSDGPGDGNWKSDMEDLVDPDDIIRKEKSSFRKSELTDDNSKELFELAGSSKEIGHYITEIYENNPQEASEICKSLSDYIKNESSSSALFNDPKLKKEYVKNVLRDIAYPTDIYQGNNGTCGATAVQVKLAKEDPKKYVEIATSLADGNSWHGIEPNRKFESNGDTRNLSSQVIQNAFMDYANGDKDWGSRKVDEAVKDSNGNIIKEGIDGGITDNQIDKLQTTLFGDATVLDTRKKSTDKVFQEIDASLENGDSVPFSAFSIDPKTGKEVGHEMLILDKTGDTYRIFTWGEERTISEVDLRKHLRTAQIADA